MNFCAIFLVFSVSFNINFVFAFSPNRLESNEKQIDIHKQVSWQLFDCQYSESDVLQQIMQISPNECKRKCEQIGDRCSHILWSNGNCLLKTGKVLNQINIELDEQNMLGICAYKHTEQSFFRSFIRAFKVFVLFILLIFASYLFAKWVDALNKSQLRLKHAHIDTHQQHQYQI